MDKDTNSGFANVKMLQGKLDYIAGIDFLDIEEEYYVLLAKAQARVAALIRNRDKIIGGKDETNS